MRWYITGDCHGNFSRFKNLPKDDREDENLGIIILGDAGFNYCLDERDDGPKNGLTKICKCKFYCVHGNHEERPSNLADITYEYDTNVDGMVYYQKKWPNIRYFSMWGCYTINGLRALVIGGAYSVDKFWRLQNSARWFESEQLRAEEKINVYSIVSTVKDFDLVLTHTCPMIWEPNDLFIGGLDQSTVDKSTEIWLDGIEETINYNVWLFGHYHSDRLERPHVEQFYTDIEALETVVDRWKKYDETKELDWWLQKAPNFYINNIGEN